MNWDAIGAIGEIIGAIAVLLTLVYLARQIKHSSDVSKVTSYHQAIDQIVQAGKDPDFSRLLTKFNTGESFSPEEKTRAESLATLTIYGHEILLHLYNKKQVDKDLWENIITNNMDYLTCEMILPVLRARPGPISHELLKLVESKSRDG